VQRTKRRNLRRKGTTNSANIQIFQAKNKKSKIKGNVFARLFVPLASAEGRLARKRKEKTGFFFCFSLAYLYLCSLNESHFPDR
jgi:hypothetical protein